MPHLLAWLRSLFRRRRPEEAPVWQRYENTDAFYREMSRQEIAADDRERLARHRAQRQPPLWLRRRGPR